MNFFCIADRESALGFKLCGVQTMQAHTRREALEALQVARANKEAGIILVTEKVADLIREEMQQHIDNNPIPLLLELPSRGTTRKRASAAELLKQLAGVGV